MASAEAPGPLIFMVAGEPSGDLIGARMMAAIKALAGQGARFAGVGGERMIAEGLIGLFPMGDLSVMGVTAVARRLPLLTRRLHQAAADALSLRPDAVITIDSPGFNVRLARRLGGRRCPLIHVVAPSVWAWRPGRAKTLARHVDHLLALLPFEPPYFDAVGLPTTFIGHPIVEEAIAAAAAIAELPAGAPLVTVLPGSREDEVRRLLPVFGATLELVRARHPGVGAVVPTLGALAPLVAEGIAGWSVPARLVQGARDRYGAYGASRVALAASGSVVLELAAAGLPAVVAYRTSAATAFVARRLLRIPRVSLVNIVAGTSVMPEFLQEKCRPEALAVALESLLADDEARSRQLEEGRRVLALLGQGAEEPPSFRAAQVVLDLIAARRQGSSDPRVSPQGGM